MKISVYTLLVAACISVKCTDALACTTFCIRHAQGPVVGKNFDFYTGVGNLVVNKRGARKSALEVPPEKVFSWTSKYGSVTFNQMGVEFPYGGMNEKGLVIEISWLAETVYPVQDDRHGLVELQWIQYQLDNFATVDEVLASDAAVRISHLSFAPVHFFICDAEGKTATFEYINGKLEAHTDTTMPVCVLANDTYVQSTDYLKTLAGNDQRSRNFTSSSYGRFAEASEMLNRFNGTEPVTYAFQILEGVRQEGFTQWNIVYDVKKRVIHYKTSANPSVRQLRVSAIDFSCGSQRLVADINTSAGASPLWQPYSFETNYSGIKKAFASVDFLQNVTEPEILQVARFPETIGCSK